MRRRMAGAAALGVLALVAPAWGVDPVAYITEIHRGPGGRVLVRAAGEREWTAARPLLALRPGDQLQARGAAHVVVLLHAGGGTRAITPESSPFTVPAAVASRGGEQLRAVTAGVERFLRGEQRAPRLRRLSTRGVCPAPLILSPRRTRLFAGAPRFEWQGCSRHRYTIRLVGPQGVVWEQADLPYHPVAYPASAPALAPGVAYRWELDTPAASVHPANSADFEILPEADAERLRRALAALDRAEGYTPGTRTVMRTALLLDERLYAEARRQLETALAAQPREPTLWMLQGYLYERMGLGALAAGAFDKAR